MRAALLIPLLFACGTAEQQPPPVEWEARQEAIVHLEADDDPSDGAADSSGYGFDAICAEGECPELMPGKIGDAYFFDGFDDHLRIPHHLDLDMTRGFTIAMWFSLDQPSTGRALLSRDLGADPMDENTYLIMQSVFCSGREDRLYFATPGTLPLCGESAIDVRGWTHVAATWDGSLKRFFIDGQVAASQGTTTIDFDEHDIIIGGNFYQDRFTAPFVGLIDDLRIYERVLEPSEVIRLPGFDTN